MQNFARDIKDLSIAMEALARIQGSDEAYSRVSFLLNNRINQMEDQQDKERREIIPERPKILGPDDEIPF